MLMLESTQSEILEREQAWIDSRMHLPQDRIEEEEVRKVAADRIGN